MIEILTEVRNSPPGYRDATPTSMRPGTDVSLTRT